MEDQIPQTFLDDIRISGWYSGTVEWLCAHNTMTMCNVAIIANIVLQLSFMRWLFHDAIIPWSSAGTGLVDKSLRAIVSIWGGTAVITASYFAFTVLFLLILVPISKFNRKYF